MSVKTEADEALDQASYMITAAIASVSEVVIERCSGCDDYTDEYSTRLEKVLIKLMNTRRMLGR